MHDLSKLYAHVMRRNQVQVHMMPRRSSRWHGLPHEYCRNGGTGISGDSVERGDGCVVMQVQQAIVAQV